MRKWCRVVAAVLLVFVLAACSGQGVPTSPSAPEATVSGMEPPVSGAQVALISTAARLADSAGKEVLTGVGKFAGESGLTSATYKTEEDDPDAAVATLELALTGGAEVVVVMGPSASAAIGPVAGRYPDVDFILVDAPEDLWLAANAVSIQFAVEQAGWMAGYLALYEAGDILAVARNDDATAQRYALGFLLGAEAAAAEKELDAGSVAVIDLLFPPDSADLGPLQRVEAVYGRGAGLVFAACPEWQQDALTASRTRQKGLIGLGMDLSVAGATALASISASPARLVYALLSGWNAGAFEGGSPAVGTVREGDLVFEARTDRLENVGALRLQRLLARFEDGELEKQLADILWPGGAGTPAAPEALGLEKLLLISTEDLISGTVDGILPPPAPSSGSTPAP